MMAILTSVRWYLIVVLICITLIIGNPTGILNSFFCHVFFWKLIENLWTLSQHKVFNCVKENAQYYKGNQLNQNTVIKIVKIQHCDKVIYVLLYQYVIFFTQGIIVLEDFQRVTGYSLLNLNQGQHPSQALTMCLCTLF